MKSRVGAAAGIILGMLMVAFLIDAFIGPRSGVRFDLSELPRAVEGIAVGLAIAGAWLVTRDRGPALVGLALSVALFVGGLVWPLSVVGSMAGVFAWPLFAAMAVRTGVELARGAGTRESRTASAAEPARDNA